jgi:predicted nuclease with TOPRIM domain
MRPKIYHTAEEQKAARRKIAKKYYDAHKNELKYKLNRKARNTKNYANLKAIKSLASPELIEKAKEIRNLHNEISNNTELVALRNRIERVEVKMAEMQEVIEDICSDIGKINKQLKWGSK